MTSLQIVLKVLLRTAFVLATAFELFGCAAPAAVTIAGLAADGASYAASGKSLGDRALSAATGSDCSMLGVIDDGVLCRDRVPEPDVTVEQGPPPLAGPPAPAPQPSPPDNSAATFLALGAYPDWDNADRAVVQGRFYNPLIVPIDGGDEMKGDVKDAAYWVVAGRPLASADGKVSIAQAKSIGFKDARTLTLCRATYRPEPCAGTDVTASAGAEPGTASQASSTAPVGPTPVAATKPVAPPIADDVPTPLIARPAQLAQRPMLPDTDTLY